MTPALHIRRGTRADAERLAAFAERTFRDSFTDENAVPDMDAYVREAFAVAHIRQELAAATNTYLLAFAKEADILLGYAKLRAGTSASSVTGPDPVELQRLYVDHRMIGQGVGAALMQACLATAQQQKHATIWLGVWERNLRAISFYERWEFTTVGQHIFQFGSDPQIDLIMTRSLTASPRPLPS